MMSDTDGILTEIKPGHSLIVVTSCLRCRELLSERMYVGSDEEATAKEIAADSQRDRAMAEREHRCGEVER